nr:hypothetical protein L203_02789 [Cryptococcus depauperatus CBS 7841]
MSLDPSPVTHSRPIAPHRKRVSSSVATSSRVFPRAGRENSPSLPFNKDAVTTAGTSVSVASRPRKRNESEIDTAGRQELEQVVQDEWEVDKMALAIESLENSKDFLERENRELKSTVLALQTRVDEAFNEQACQPKTTRRLRHMEDGLQERDELLERLRKRSAEAERTLKESQKRHTDQELSFEAERRASQAQEEHLQKKINTLLSAARKQPSEIPIPNQVSDTELASLKDEVACLKLSYSTLLAKYNTLVQEVQDLRTANRSLQEENEGWEFLVRERTLSGNFREKGGLLNQEGKQEIQKSEGVEDSPDEYKVGLASTKSQSRHGGNENLNTVPLDLAAELNRVSPGQQNLAPDSIDEKDETIGQISLLFPCLSELKQLKEANKALTLYCSKIIDRIIAQEGFEHILSVDYKTRRTDSRHVSEAMPLQEISASLANATMPKSEEPLPPPIVSIQSSTQDSSRDKKARPLSMVVNRAFGGAAEKTPTASTPFPNVEPPSVVPIKLTPTQPELASETKQERRTRRGFSLDFRSFSFGLTSPTPASGIKASLRPLALSSQVAPAASSPTEKEPIITARKLEQQEEDEEDKRERHQMEATLKSMGIQKLSDREEELAKGPQDVGRKSPWSRLYATFGSAEQSPTPRDAETTLKDFHCREADRIKALSEGKAETNYTTPSKIGSSIRQSSDAVRDRAASGASSRTFWSFGSS